MSDCAECPVEKQCHYPFKPCDCVHQRKFWDKARREKYEREKEAKEKEKDSYKPHLNLGFDNPPL